MSETKPTGFGGRTFRADGPLSIWVNPLERVRDDGSTGITLGFRLAILTMTAGEDETLAEQLAEYLSCPKRAAAPDLYEALAKIADGSAFRHQRFAEDNDPDYFLRCQREVQKLARAALAKSGASS